MAKNPKSAADFLPETLTLPSLRKAAAHCRGCHLYQHATQTVFGEGAKSAALMVVGEIPGDKEDQQGHPFVGPAGTLLRKAFETSGVDINDLYLTNVVKHFKFSYVNQRKLHRSPIGSEIKACLPWLTAEIEVVKPKVILCLGATAAKAIMYKDFRMKEEHGQWYKKPPSPIAIIATYHPSSVLRAITHDDRDVLKNILLKDLKKVARFLEKSEAIPSH